jgi:hypothetical protein
MRKREFRMVGKKVMCRVRSAVQTKTVYGTLVQQCNNANVYVLKLDHAVDFVNQKTYTYPKGSTILVTDSEIVK